MAAEIFGAQAVWIVLLGLASFGAVVWAVLDAAMRPGTAFRDAGQSKALWIVLPIVGLGLFAVAGGILGVVYLTVIRPKVRLAQ
jgi:hypothetical protein